MHLAAVRARALEERILEWNPLVAKYSVFANRISYFELLKSNILEIATCFRQIHAFPPWESRNSGQKRVQRFLLQVVMQGHRHRHRHGRQS